MKGFTFATVAALAATAFAATIKLEETACIGSNATSFPQFDVEVEKLSVVKLSTVCGLKLISADGADVKAIKCQAYRDAEGTTKGSAEFTYDDPALIATNPVQVGSILCISSGSLPSAQPTTFAAVTTSVVLALPTGGASPTSNSTGSKPSSASPSSTNPADLHGAASTLTMSLSALSVAAIAFFFL